MKHIDDYSVHDDFPESLNRPNAKELADLWDQIQLKFIDSQIRNILIYPVIDELPSDLVDALAIQLHCDFYDKSLSIEARRQIVKTSIAWHRIKGTPAAVEMLTQTIFHDSHTKEWFEYGGRPYFFRMVQDISDGTEDVTRETLNLLKKAIWKGKNVRSWLEMLEFHVHLHEKMDYSEELSTLAIRYDLEDWMPYGNRLWMPERDGSLYRGGAAYRDGEFFRNGSLLHDGMIPGDWPFHHGWDELSMDEMFAAACLSLYDDVSESDIMRNGGICRDGIFFHSKNILPADFGFGFAMRQEIQENIQPPGDSGLAPNVSFLLSDIIHYGTNPLADRSGIAERGGTGCMDRSFERDGSYSRDGPLLDANAERGGASDLAHDHLTIAVHNSITEDVSEEYITRDGRESREGEILHGINPLPRDAGMAIVAAADMEDEAEPTDAGGGLSVLYSIYRRGDFRRDGTIERGGYSYDDDLDGDFSLCVMDRSGEYCRDGETKRAADGRLLAL